MATLADLPTELLLLIFQRITTDAILNIGKLCRRLNTIAIPIFLDRLGLSDPKTSSILTPPYQGCGDALTGLTLHFSMTKIKQLVCILGNNPLRTEIDASASVTRSILRIHQLLNRLSSIDSLSLFLRIVGQKWTLRSQFVQEFVIALLSLLRTAVLKSCKSFQIIYPHPMVIDMDYNFQTFDQSTPSILRNIVHLLARYLPWKKMKNRRTGGYGWRYQQVSRDQPTQALTMPLVGFQNELTDLELSSDFLVIPPFSMWTFDIMKFSRITSFSLSLSHNVTREEFHSFIFPNIATKLPQLREIRVAFHREDFLATVVENMPCFQYLQKVTIGLPSYGNLPPITTKMTQLQNLVTFTGSLKQATYFFQSISCPNLKFINIIIDSYFQATYDHKATVNLFSSLSKRLSNLGIKPCVRVCLSANMDPPSPSLTSRTLGEDPEGTEHLSIVSGLTLELPIFFRNELEVEHQAEHALAWLAVFHRLEKLTLTTRRVIIDTPARETRDSTLYRMITAEYPNLTSFNVVDLLFDEYHYHWSNSRDELTRGIDGVPTMAILRSKSTTPCICSHF